MSTTLTLRTDDEVAHKLTQIAESMNRNRNWIINEAINNYLELHEWRLEHVNQGMSDTDAGRTVSFDEVKARILKRHKARLKKKE